MIDLTGVTHHPAIEELVEVLCNKTQNTDRGFFRCEVAYFLGKMASSMRATIVTKDRGDIPVNIYALALATSGFGKGHSVNVVENEFMRGFKKRFLEDTMPVISEQNHWVIGNDRAVRQNTDPQEEFEKVQKEYKRTGAFAYTFDSGTPPAVKQLRHKLLLANCGSINLQIDEIGSNLIGSVDILNLFLELYDQGVVKAKLTKVTADNERTEELDGKTPTNMLLFGTPAKLFDGGITEDQFYSFLETGYARRCLFGVGQQDRKAFNSQSPEEIYERLTEPQNNETIQRWAAHFHSLADPGMFGWKMVVEKEVGTALVSYKIACEQAAELMPDHAEIQKAELSHRYFKALKLAGALAFIDQCNEIELLHLQQAILLVEESGVAFTTILKREKVHVKLAKYIATCGEDLTQADLIEALPFYKKGVALRNEMMTLATAWGYKNNVIIKKTFVDGIEFYKGETLQETDLNDMIFSYSDNWAYEYAPPEEPVPFDQLHVLTQAQDMHWANHHFKNKHRAEENVVPGFNMLVLDVDGGISVDLVRSLLTEVKHFIYTTKRSTPEENRFRLIIPINYRLELDKDEYGELVNEVVSWLPFKTADVDASSSQRSKKWMTFEGGEYHYNMDGDLFDVLPFIPKTSKNEAHKKDFKAVASLDNLERWFAQRIVTGSRNNHMVKFALALLDSGLDLVTVSRQVHAFNKKLSDPMDADEIDSTIMVTVGKRYQKLLAA